MKKDLTLYRSLIKQKFETIRIEQAFTGGNEIILSLDPSAPQLLNDLYGFLRRKFKAHFVQLFAIDEQALDGTFKVVYVFSAPSDKHR